MEILFRYPSAQEFMHANPYRYDLFTTVKFIKIETYQGISICFKLGIHETHPMELKDDMKETLEFKRL